jgi:CPA2 family monovalent cation:H+ antiporter-2
MPGHSILQDLVLVYAVAVAFLIVAGRLRVPPIVALIGAGVAAGPGGFRIVGTQDEVELLAEVGIVLLLFMVGLDFSLRELRRVWRAVVVGGTAQVLVTAGLVAGVLLASGAAGARLAAFIGLFVALSSTAIVIKDLARRNEIHAPHGRVTIGVLLLQDLLVVVLLVLLPPLLGPGADLASLPRVLLQLALVAGAVLGTARVALPWLLRTVSATSRDAFSMAVLLASVGVAWLTAQLGLSMAVGAFLGGLVLAESEFAHQIHAEVRPLRDLLASLFFISVGMLVETRGLLDSLPLVLAVAVAIVVVKAAAGSAALRLASPTRVAVAGGVALAQVGEFSFVVGKAGLASGLLAPEAWQILLPAAILTMLATPFLVAAAPAAGVAATRALRTRAEEAGASEMPALSGHVVILGYGAGGQLLAQALGELGVAHVVLELNGAAVAAGRARGVAIHYADATAIEPLEAASLPRAAALVAVLSDPDATVRAIRAARAVAPRVPVLARARYRGEAERMRAAGATLAVAEEMEGSLEVLAQLLARLHVPGNLVDVLLDGFRRVAAAGRTHHAAALPFDALPPEVSAAPVASHALAEGAWAVGRTLTEIQLRAQTHATAIAIKRAGRYLTPPPPAEPLRAGDVLYLLGDDSDVTLARALLNGAAAPGSPTAP